MAYSNETGYPSVTQILRPFINSDWFLPEHAERGSAVHSAAAAHLKGAYVPPLAPDHQPYFDSFRKWAEVSIDTVILVEERIIDPGLGFCGQPDLVCVMRGDTGNTLADFKTSQAVQKWWRLQSSAYSHLCVEAKDMVIHRRISVRLKNDGSGCLIDEYSGLTDWNVFRSALNCFYYFGG